MELEFSSFDECLTAANEFYDQREFSSARALYQLAVDLDPTHQNTFFAVVRIEYCDDIIAARAWFGDKPPQYHPVGILGALQIAPQTENPLHHVLFGQEAYEAFHVHHYLTELLRLRRHPNVLHSSFLLLYYAMLATRAETTEFIEIGASLYGAFEKIESCKAYARAHGITAPEPDIHHLCVELAPRLRLIAQALHEGRNISYFPMWNDVPPPVCGRFAFSLGVANYAFTSTESLVEWLMQCRAAVIRERFVLGFDFVHHILGKRFTCFDFNSLKDMLERHGYGVKILSAIEAPQFIEDQSKVRNKEDRFFNATILIYRLSEDEMNTVLKMVSDSASKDLRPFYDADTPVVLCREILERSSDEVLAEMAWKRDYVRPLPPHSQTTQPLDHMFRPQIHAQFEAHLGKLDLAYGTSLKQHFCSQYPLSPPPPRLSSFIHTLKGFARRILGK